MGMAASQARYLGLTARKTNTEYEGQQVNQQRTALANQSAGLFSQLMALNVPTAPSSGDFTTVEYNYTDGFNSETILTRTPLAGDPDYNYTVSHYHTESVYQAVQQVRNNPEVEYVDPSYWVGNLRTYAYDADTDQAAVAQIATDYNTSNLANAYNGVGGHTAAEIFRYQSGGQTYYVCQQDLEASIDSGTAPQTSLNLYYAADINERALTSERAYIETDETGRLSSITLESMPDTQFELETTSATDQDAYNDAMNQYTYDTNVYQKAVQDINARTSIIQQQDRELELRLKQLDTEQEALQTEMESVKKVIDKNIESTFKTFS